MRMGYTEELIGIINVVDKSICKDFVAFQLPTIDAKCRQLRFTTTDNPDGDMPMSQFTSDHTIVTDDCLIDICCESMDELVKEFDKQVFDKLCQAGTKVELNDVHLNTSILLESQRIAIDSRRGPATAILSPFGFDEDIFKHVKNTHIDESRDYVTLAYKGSNEYDAGVTIIPIHYQFNNLEFRNEKDEHKFAFYLCLGPNPERYIRIIKGVK